MADGNALGQVFNPSTGVWALVAMAAVTLFKVWPLVMARVNERLRDKETEKNGEWSRLHEEITRLVDRINQIETRCDHLQKEVDECREREGDWMRRAIAAEAASEGMGEARQVAQRIVSTEMQSLKPKDQA